jgi:hypothetical protein
VSSESVTTVITSFIAIIIFITGFIIGERQSKTMRHNFAENILSALQIASQGNIENTKYNRLTENYEPKYPNFTTGESRLNPQTTTGNNDKITTG